MSDSEFYIGYMTEAPPRTARFLRRTIASLILVGVVLAVTVAALQKPFDPGQFEYGVLREFTGVLLERPVPTLVVSAPELSRLLLVKPGKFGAEDLVAGMDGETVQVQGSLIHRRDAAMIELVPDSIQVVGAATELRVEAAIALGEHTLVGEIVDSKCYLGVMKPGREKTHRACAVRCISGGIPPMLRTTSLEGKPTHLLLTGRDGEPINRQILEFVAEPVEVSGTIQRHGEQLVLRTDPSSIHRLSD